LGVLIVPYKFIIIVDINDRLLISFTSSDLYTLIKVKILKDNWKNIFFVLVIVLLFIPQISTPIKVFLNRLVAFSPSETNTEDRQYITDYNWPLTSLDSEVVNLSVSKGKVCIINLWATWCPPCIAEMPSLQNLYNRYGDKVDFYFVSTEPEEKLLAYKRKHEYNFPIYIQTYMAPEVLDSNSLPTTYVISKDGAIVVEKTGAARWDSKSVYEMIDQLIAD
jgi:thiol-disulfide isomerase/thioredoxin